MVRKSRFEKALEELIENIKSVVEQLKKLPHNPDQIIEAKKITLIQCEENIQKQFEELLLKAQDLREGLCLADELNDLIDKRVLIRNKLALLKVDEATQIDNNPKLD